MNEPRQPTARNKNGMNNGATIAPMFEPALKITFTPKQTQNLAIHVIDDACREQQRADDPAESARSIHLRSSRDESFTRTSVSCGPDLLSTWTFSKCIPLASVTKTPFCAEM